MFFKLQIPKGVAPRMLQILRSSVSAPLGPLTSATISCWLWAIGDNCPGGQARNLWIKQLSRFAPVFSTQ